MSQKLVKIENLGNLSEEGNCHLQPELVTVSTNPPTPFLQREEKVSALESSKGRRRCQLSPGISLYSEPDNESTQVATFRATFKTSSSYRQTPFEPLRPSIKMITVRGDQGQDQSRLSYEGSSSHNHSHTCFVCTHTTLII